MATRSGPSGIASRPNPWTASHSISAPAWCAICASSATGWMTPISLLTSMTATRAIWSSIAASAISRSTRPSPPTWQANDLDALPLQPFGGIEHRGMLGRDGDQLAALRLLERSFQRPVERFGRAGGEGEAAASQAERLLDPVAGHFDRRGRLAAPARRADADWRISPRSTDASPRPPRARPASSPDNRDRSCRALSRTAIRRHSARKASTSASVVSGPKLMRRNPPAISGSTPIAASTALSFILPDEQALPAETAMPARSNWTSSEALDAPGSETAPIVGSRGLSSPITTPPAALRPRRACDARRQAAPCHRVWPQARRRRPARWAASCVPRR